MVLNFFSKAQLREVVWDEAEGGRSLVAHNSHIVRSITCLWKELTSLFRSISYSLSDSGGNLRMDFTLPMRLGTGTPKHSSLAPLFYFQNCSQEQITLPMSQRTCIL